MRTMMSYANRLASVRQLGILDTPADERYDRVTRTTALVLGCSSAGIGFVSDGGIWFKSVVGADPAAVATHCRELIDAAQPRYIAATLSASGPGFFAGHPLYAPDGTCIGALCGFDAQPRDLSAAQRAALRDLAAMVEELLAAKSLLQTQRELRASEQRYRALFEANSDAVYTIDVSGRFTSCNDALVRLAGYSREELIGQPFAPLVAPEYREVAHEAFQRCLGGESVYINIRLLPRCGREQYASISASPYVVDGELQGVVGITREVTAQVIAERRLKESEERLRLALTNSRQGVWEWDIANRRVYHSPELRALYGFPPQSCWETSEQWYERVHPDDREGTNEQGRSVFRDLADSYQGESRIRCANGQYRWIRYHGKIVARREDGKPLRAIGVTTDIHEQKLAEQERRRDAERMALAVQAGGVGIFEADLDSGVVTWDARMYELLGLQADGSQVTLERMLQAVHAEDRARMRAIVAQLREGRLNAVDSERRVVWPDGSVHHLRVLGRVFRFSPDGPRLLIGTCWDVTEARELQQQLTHQATHDVLTGLYNRFEFERRLQEVQRARATRGKQHALCFIDLDRFKIVNDTAGHAVGDALLYELGQALAREVRTSDVLARLGGDEFALLLVDCSVERAEAVARKLIDRIENLGFRWQGRSYDISASIGIARLPIGDVGTADVMAQADVACYAAKAGGRGRVCVYLPERSDAQQHHRELIVAATIREAVAASRFRLYAQEIVVTDPRRDDRRHFELLLRMHDADGSLIPPGTFIPAAERYGLMAQVDRWVLRKALEDQARQLAAVPGLTIAINLSAHSLNDPNFLALVETLVQKSPLPTSRICFEITETAAVTHLAAAGEVIERLRALGCAIALDDFGSGLSSFGYLKHFKIDYVKIDGGFIRELGNSASDRAIARSIHALAREFGARTIAEYVESDEVFAVVRDLGIDYAQGYAIGHPRPLEEVLASFDPVSPCHMANR